MVFGWVREFFVGGIFQRDNFSWGLKFPGGSFTLKEFARIPI